MTVEAGDHVSVRRATAEEVRERAHELADILMDAVEGGATVTVLKPLPPLAAVRWALDMADAMHRSTHVFLAERDGGLIGTVSLVRTTALNQPHRAGVSQLMVRRSARRQGVGRALMREVETSARVMGISLLTIDTAAGGPAPPLYEGIGYLKAGVVPGYLLDADGRPVDVAIYYKTLH